MLVVGIHRSVAVSKIRSLRMDSRVWKPSVIQVRDTGTKLSVELISYTGERYSDKAEC